MASDYQSNSPTRRNLPLHTSHARRQVLGPRGLGMYIPLPQGSNNCHNVSDKRDIHAQLNGRRHSQHSLLDVSCTTRLFAPSSPGSSSCLSSDDDNDSTHQLSPALASLVNTPLSPPPVQPCAEGFGFTPPSSPASSLTSPSLSSPLPSSSARKKVRFALSPCSLLTPRTHKLQARALTLSPMTFQGNISSNSLTSLSTISTFVPSLATLPPMAAPSPTPSPAPGGNPSQRARRSKRNRVRARARTLTPSAVGGGKVGARHSRKSRKTSLEEGVHTRQQGEDEDEEGTSAPASPVSASSGPDGPLPARSGGSPAQVPTSLEQLVTLSAKMSSSRTSHPVHRMLTLRRLQSTESPPPRARGDKDKAEESIRPTPQPEGHKHGSHKKCNCKKSKCLKLYCECFARQGYCVNCNCTCCNNLPQFEHARQKAIQATLERDPQAFFRKKKSGIVNDGTHLKGCNCKKSECRKKYCECFQAGVKCGEHCKCLDCKNGKTGSCDHSGGRKNPKSRSRKAGSKNARSASGDTPTTHDTADDDSTDRNDASAATHTPSTRLSTRLSARRLRASKRTNESAQTRSKTRTTKPRRRQVRRQMTASPPPNRPTNREASSPPPISRLSGGLVMSMMGSSPPPSSLPSPLASSSPSPASLAPSSPTLPLPAAASSSVSAVSYLPSNLSEGSTHQVSILSEGSHRVSNSGVVSSNPQVPHTMSRVYGGGTTHATYSNHTPTSYNVGDHHPSTHPAPTTHNHTTTHTTTHATNQTTTHATTHATNQTTNHSQTTNAATNHSQTTNAATNHLHPHATTTTTSQRGYHNLPMASAFTINAGPITTKTHTGTQAHTYPPTNSAYHGFNPSFGLNSLPSNLPSNFQNSSFYVPTLPPPLPIHARPVYPSPSSTATPHPALGAYVPSPTPHVPPPGVSPSLPATTTPITA